MSILFSIHLKQVSISMTYKIPKYRNSAPSRSATRQRFPVRVIALGNRVQGGIGPSNAEDRRMAIGKGEEWPKAGVLRL